MASFTFEDGKKKSGLNAERKLSCNMEPKRKNIHCNERPHMQLGMSSKPTLSEQTRFPDDETGEIAKKVCQICW